MTHVKSQGDAGLTHEVPVLEVAIRGFDDVEWFAGADHHECPAAAEAAKGGLADTGHLDAVDPSRMGLDRSLCVRRTPATVREPAFARSDLDQVAEVRSRCLDA